MQEHTKQLAEALATILDAIEAHERARRDNPLRKVVRSTFVLLTLEECERYFDRGEDYVADPVGQALRAGVKSLGRVIAKIATREEMEEIADFAANRNGSFQFRVDVIDKRWDGIEANDRQPWVA